MLGFVPLSNLHSVVLFSALLLIQTMAYLIVTSGPATGLKYKIHFVNTILGRHPDCDMVLDSSEVSRRHTRLIQLANDYFIEDLDSLNNTLLNDQCVNERKPIIDGDRITLGDVDMLFQNTPNNTTLKNGHTGYGTENATLLISSAEENSNTIIRSSFDAASHTSGKSAGATADTKLNALIEVMNCLANTLDLDQVLPGLLESLFKIFTQADRGFIVMKDEQGELKPRWSKVRDETIKNALCVSKAIIDHVINTNNATLSEDAACDQRFDSSESILAYQIHTVMCAPLISTDGIAFGVLQIDSFNRLQRFRPEDLEVLASVAKPAAIAINNAFLHDKMLKQKVIERDLELAQRVQQSFLPESAPTINEYRFFHYYLPANQIGGDFFDYITLPDGQIMMIVADVVGHGVAAALLMVKLSAHVRSCLAGETSPARAVERLNTLFFQQGLRDRFITFLMVVLNPVRHELSVVNAGHMAPLIRRQNGDLIRIGETEKGIPLGILDTFEYQSSKTYIAPGELVVMYTDGINESQNEDKTFYGEERIERLMQSEENDAIEFGRKLIDDLNFFCSRLPGRDDICLLTFSRNQSEQ